MEGQRNVLEDVGAHGIVIVLHVQEERLLVINMEVVLDFVVQLCFGKLRNFCVGRAGTCVVALRLLYGVLQHAVVHVLGIG